MLLDRTYRGSCETLAQYTLVCGRSVDKFPVTVLHFMSAAGVQFNLLSLLDHITTVGAAICRHPVVVACFTGAAARRKPSPVDVLETAA